MKRTNSFVLDSYSLLCYLEGEANAEIVADILKKGLTDKSEIYMSVVNWGEVFYIVLREHGEEAVEKCFKAVSRHPINIIDVDKDLTVEAAKLKASYKISYADSFAAALAKSKNAKLVTGNKDFTSLKSECSILWL